MDQAELLRALQAANANAERMADENSETKARLLDVEQRLAHRPSGGTSDDGRVGELAELIAGSEGVKSFLAGNTPTVSIQVPTRLLTKNTIINATGVSQPLVAADRRPGISFAPQQRLTVRGLFNANPTSSNLIEVAKELSYTNAATPQGGPASPQGSGEGELKAESSLTFQLENVPVVTIAHFIVASRQILSDAPRLQGHIEGRLLYGLALEEEREFLTGDGTAGEMTGINLGAATFTGGGTNQGAIDTLAKAANQLAVGNYEPSGFILHPTDWLNMKLLKDTTGRYILGDPAEMTTPQLWGLPVVPTVSQTLGSFTVLDARQLGEIADRETATVRISENVNDAFIRNLLHLLAEERTVLVIEKPSAAVYGSLSYAG